MEEEVRICDYCGRVLAEGEGTPVDDELLCDDCIEEHCVTCDHCGETIWEQNSVSDEDPCLCQDCFDTHYYRCESCGQIVPESIVCWHGDLPYCRGTRERSSGTPGSRPRAARSETATTTRSRDAAAQNRSPSPTTACCTTTGSFAGNSISRRHQSKTSPPSCTAAKNTRNIRISQMQRAGERKVRAAQLPCRAPWTTQKTTAQRRHYPEITRQQRQNLSSWRLICGTFAGRPGAETTRSGSRCTALDAARRRGRCRRRKQT